ncbi:Kinesin light chain 1 [Paramyrothecium foliicola]|nr:Kinesin light chain 1 [Paramyrothecium foliicola]
MADPVSIVAAAVGIADVAARLIFTIREFQKDIKGIEDELESLADEINALTKICVSIEAIYNTKASHLLPSPSDNSAGAEDLRMHLRRALSNCLDTVTSIEEIVTKIHKDSVSETKFDAIKKIMRKRLQEGDLRYRRAQLAAHQNALQLVLTASTFQNMNTAQHSTAQSLGDISEDLQNLSNKFDSQITVLRQDIKSADGFHYDKTALAALVDLREAVISVAATVKSASTNHYFDIPQSVRSIYTGREALLEELRQLFVPSQGTTRQQSQKRFVIYGLGGSGKTQFCCKFAEDYRESFWGVFYVDASTIERVKHSLGDIAAMAGLERNDKLALHWLSNLQHRWLLIIDNADDESIPIEECFPKGNRGNILVTTRNPARIEHGNVGRGHFEFHGLELEEATKLLLKASNEPAPWDASRMALALKIAEALGFLALAIIHAGAAIRDKLCGFRDYLAYYDRSWQKIRKAKLFKKGSTTDNAAYTTWETCYEGLEAKGTEETSDALQLLNVLAFLHRENISEEIFTRALTNSGIKDTSTPSFHPVTWEDRVRQLRLVIAMVFRNRGPPFLPNVFRDASKGGEIEDAKDRILKAFRELSQRSLIIRNDHSDTYSMHPIIHRWARERPRLRLADQALWADVTGRVLAASILLPPLGRTAADEKYNISLLPHVEHVQGRRAHASTRMSLEKPSLLSWVTNFVPTLTIDGEKMAMYGKFAVIYAACGRWENAKLILEEVNDFLHRYMGPGHERSRAVTLYLSRIYWTLGRPADAAVLQTSLLELCKSHLGPKHLETFRAMRELGHTRWQQGQYSTARVLQETALEGLKTHLPSDHVDVFLAMDHLGSTVHKFWEDHHFERAYQLHSDAAAGLEAKLGPDHNDTLWAKQNKCRVAVLLGGQHVDPALSLMSEVLETRRAKLGKEHSLTLFAMGNMAIVLSAKGRVAEAEDLVRQGLPIAEQTLGSDHIGTLFGQHTLACILSQRGRYAEAEELLIRVTDSQKRMNARRGDFHPDRLGALIELAHCYYSQGKLVPAMEVCDEAIHGFHSISKEEHPLAIGLRSARACMEKVANDGERQDIKFPFVLFRPCDDNL